MPVKSPAIPVRPNRLRSRLGDGIGFTVMACDSVASDVSVVIHVAGLRCVVLRVADRRLKGIRMAVVTNDRGNSVRFSLPRSKKEAKQFGAGWMRATDF